MTDNAAVPTIAAKTVDPNVMMADGRITPDAKGANCNPVSVSDSGSGTSNADVDKMISTESFRDSRLSAISFY
jgi:hypothetical protein